MIILIALSVEVNTQHASSDHTGKSGVGETVDPPCIFFGPLIIGWFFGHGKSTVDIPFKIIYVENN